MYVFRNDQRLASAEILSRRMNYESFPDLHSCNKSLLDC